VVGDPMVIRSRWTVRSRPDYPPRSGTNGLSGSNDEPK